MAPKYKLLSSQIFGAVRLVSLSILTLCLTTLAAQAEDTNARLDRLQRDIETLNQAVYKGQQPPTPLVSGSSGASSDYQSNVESRLSQMESQMRDLTGKIEQQGYDLNQLKQRFDRTAADMELRMNSAQGNQAHVPQSQNAGNNGAMTPANQTGTLQAGDMGGDVPPPEMTSESPNAGSTVDSPPDDSLATDGVAPENSPTQQNLGTLTQTPAGLSASVGAANGATGGAGGVGDAAAQYESAYSLYKSGNYKASRAGFDQFLKSFPNHPLAPNALYWSGENYYAEKTYDKAIRVFAESYKKYPKGPKAAESLLKLGMALNKSGKAAQACITYAQLKQEYPTGNNNVLRMADQEIATLKCSP
ncbi:MAG: tol-pal system protein YbgF [Alphaproteobacteria bacterium]|nr:tol-pal system protein YbgF [Alphaproteobacteria bacterium]